MKLIKLTDDQISDLIVFLNRTKLDGIEVPKFVSIMTEILKSFKKSEIDNTPK